MLTKEMLLHELDNQSRTARKTAERVRAEKLAQWAAEDQDRRKTDPMAWAVTHDAEWHRCIGQLDALDAIRQWAIRL